MFPRLLTLLAAALLTASLAAGLAPVAPATPAQAEHHVHVLMMGAFVFDPPVLQVAVGDSVVFHSHDNVHTATSGLLSETEVAEAALPGALHLDAFDTAFLAAGDSEAVTIGEAGAFPYYCKVGLHRLLFQHGLIVAQ